jgi:Family of unknown function (DUF5995)
MPDTPFVRALTALLTAAAVGAGAAAPSGAASAPGRPSSCHGPVVECVAGQEAVLGALQEHLGCDHRAPFAALYTTVQQLLGHTLREQPGFFTEPRWAAGDLNSAFTARYLSAYRADRDGQPLPRAWHIAFDAAHRGQTLAGQDALLGANAHIQRDMPYVLARLGLTRPDGTTRKGDFDRVQAVLDRAYGPAVREVTRRYDPLLAVADDRWTPVAGLTAHQLLALWRHNAWTYARQLTTAHTTAQTQKAAAAIEANAAAWATLLAAVQVPGYRLVRDTYCRGGSHGQQHGGSRGGSHGAPGSPGPGTGAGPGTGWTPPPLPAALESGRLRDGG